MDSEGSPDPFDSRRQCGARDPTPCAGPRRNFYLDLFPLPGPDGSGNRDSAAIVRVDTAWLRADTLARLAPLDNKQRYRVMQAGDSSAPGVQWGRPLGRAVGRVALGGKSLR